MSTPSFPGEWPQRLVIPDARDRIRASHRTTGRRIAVLDDDPTGSQTVHDVSVVTVFEEPEYAAALRQAGDTCFVLTNTRSLSEQAAVHLTSGVGRTLFALAEKEGYPVAVVSRSDSTLRGHFYSEVRALDAARRSVTGRGYDGVVLAPGFFEAGRFTAGSVHWARVGGETVPVGQTEFAKDATFGYDASDLRDFVAEKSGGPISRDQVFAVTLDDIRLGGPERVAEIVSQVTDGAFVVVDGLDYADYEVVVLGLLAAEEAGRSFVYRTGPSFVRALAGNEPKDPLTPADIWPDGHPGGHGLVVVGSHVGLTSRQVAKAQERGNIDQIELSVPTLVDAATRDDTWPTSVAAWSRLSAPRTSCCSRAARCSGRRRRRQPRPLPQRLHRRHRSRARGADRPSLLGGGEGGITSHDVAVRGLGIRRAEVLGQLFPGLVSVFRPVEAAAEAIGVPYVVFAGNVGDEDTLADVIASFRSQG